MDQKLEEHNSPSSKVQNHGHHTNDHTPIHRQMNPSSFPKNGHHNFNMIVPKYHRKLAVSLGTIAWLWIFWRLRKDGAHVFLGKHPWEH
jgi:hypothetical protein